MAEFSTTKQIMQMWVHLKISYKTRGSGGGYVAESCPTLAIPWTVCNRQAPLSREFSRQEYWNGLPFPSPRDLPNPGIKPGSPTLQSDCLPSEPPGKPKGPTYLLSRDQHICHQNFPLLFA